MPPGGLDFGTGGEPRTVGFTLPHRPPSKGGPAGGSRRCPVAAAARQLVQNNFKKINLIQKLFCSRCRNAAPEFGPPTKGAQAIHKAKQIAALVSVPNNGPGFGSEKRHPNLYSFWFDAEARA